MDVSVPLAATEQRDLLELALITGLAIGGQLLASRLRVPSIVVLLALGLLAGPVAGLVDPDELIGDLLFPLVSFAVAVILFEGGLLLNLRELRGGVGSAVRRLLTVGALVTWVGVGAAAVLLLGLDTRIAALLGAILVVSGPTVVLPLMRFIRPTGRVASALKWEGIFIDPLGAILAVLVFEALLVGERAPSLADAGLQVLYSLVAGSIVGGLVAVGLLSILRSHRLQEAIQPLATLAGVFVAFAVADIWRAESGLIAATLMGVVLANQRQVSVERIAEFKETLGILLTSLLFIVLPARLELSDLEAAIGVRELAFLVILVVVVRPLAVALSTAGSSLDGRSRLFLAAMAPRGVVAAAIASLFGLQLAERGVEDAELLAPLTFLVILGTAAIYGLSGRPLARRLGLAGEEPDTTLVVGGGRVPRALAHGLNQLGAEVVYAPGYPAGPGEHPAGLEVYRGHLLDDLDDDQLGLDRIARVLILSGSDEYNSVVATRMGKALGRRKVFQLAVERGRGPRAVELRGRPLFGRDVTYERLDQRLEESPDGEMPIVTRGDRRMLIVDAGAELGVYLDPKEGLVVVTSESNAGEDARSTVATIRGWLRGRMHRARAAFQGLWR